MEQDELTGALKIGNQCTIAQKLQLTNEEITENQSYYQKILFLAAKYDNVMAISMLINRNIPLDTINQDGNSIFEIAIIHNSICTKQYLLDYYPDYCNIWHQSIAAEEDKIAGETTNHVNTNDQDFISAY